MADLALFKTCMSIEERLDLEALDVILFQPLQDLHAWWTRQSEATKAYLSFLGGAEITALSFWVGKASGLVAAEVAALFATLLTAVLAAIPLGLFMAAVGRCLARQL